VKEREKDLKDRERDAYAQSVGNEVSRDRGRRGGGRGKNPLKMRFVFKRDLAIQAD